MDTPTIGLSFLAGLLSFLSPCVLPLLPSYLSFVGGVSIKQIQEGAAVRRSLMMNTTFFVLGFSAVFIALGVFFSSSALLFPNATKYINFVAGALVVVLGLNVIFDFVSVLNIERRLHLRKRPKGGVGSFLIGVAFAAGWTPCIGPILTSILFLAGASGRVATGILYLAIYSAGLSVPFLLTAFFFNRATSLFQKIKKHFLTIRVVSGLLLVTIGVLIFTGRFQNLNIALYRSALVLNDWAEQSPSASRLIPGIVLAVIALIPMIYFGVKLFVRNSAGRQREEPVPKMDVTFRISSSGDGATLIPQRRARVPLAIGFGAILLIVATLQLTGVLNLISAADWWLKFQGL